MSDSDDWDEDEALPQTSQGRQDNNNQQRQDGPSGRGRGRGSNTSNNNRREQEGSERQDAQAGRSKKKMNGYLLFALNKRRQYEEEAGEKMTIPLTDVLRRFDGDWKNLSELEREEWKAKAKGSNNSSGAKFTNKPGGSSSYNRGGGQRTAPKREEARPKVEVEEEWDEEEEQKKPGSSSMTSTKFENSITALTKLELQSNAPAFPITSIPSSSEGQGVSIPKVSEKAPKQKVVGDIKLQIKHPFSELPGAKFRFGPGNCDFSDGSDSE